MAILPEQFRRCRAINLLSCRLPVACGIVLLASESAFLLVVFAVRELTVALFYGPSGSQTKKKNCK